jgi:hypothetical protein
MHWGFLNALYRVYSRWKTYNIRRDSPPKVEVLGRYWMFKHRLCRRSSALMPICSVSQNLRLLWNPKAHYNVSKRLSMVLTWTTRLQSTHSNRISVRSTLILSSHLRFSIPNGTLPQASQPKVCTQYSSPPCVPHVPPISFSLILWLYNLKNSANYETLRYGKERQY